MDAQSKPSEFVTLASNDGFEFVISRSAACISGTIRRMLDPSSSFSEARTGRCVFENMNGVVLEKVCEYFLYNERNEGQESVADMDIPPDLCLELLMAADYLDIRDGAGSLVSQLAGDIRASAGHCIVEGDVYIDGNIGN